MAVIDVNEVPSSESDNQPKTPDPRLITYDDAYSLEVAGVESEAVPYGQPIEMRLPDVRHWLAWCDLDPATDEVFTTLDYYVYCNGAGVEVEIEDAEDDGDEDEILVEADPHHPLTDKLINQQGETEAHE